MGPHCVRCVLSFLVNIEYHQPTLVCYKNLTMLRCWWYVSECIVICLSVCTYEIYCGHIGKVSGISHTFTLDHKSWSNGFILLVFLCMIVRLFLLVSEYKFISGDHKTFSQTPHHNDEKITHTCYLKRNIKHLYLRIYPFEVIQTI